MANPFGSGEHLNPKPRDPNASNSDDAYFNQQVTPEANAAQNTDGYTPVKFEFPLSPDDRANSRITFEIIEVRSPSFSVNFKSALNWLSVKTEQDRTRPDRTEIAAANEDIGATASIADLERKKNDDPIGKVEKFKVIPTGKKVDLYVPQAHQITEVFNYNVPDLGGIGGGILAGMEGGASAAAAIRGAFETGRGSIDTLISAVSGDGVKGLAAARAANVAPIGQGARNAVQLLARASLHPNQRTVFERPQIRRYSFQFKFIPKSREEADAIKQIITFFRYHAHPETLPVEANGFSIPLGYKHPDMFRIKVFHKIESRGFNDTDLKSIYLRDQISLLDSYLESISTNFNPTMAVYHADGSPVETDLTLNFVEHRALTRADVLPGVKMPTAGNGAIVPDGSLLSTRDDGGL